MINGLVVGGTTNLTPLGMDGGGWVTGIDIAADGYMVCRNDTVDCHVRGPNDTSWRALLKPGVTYPLANQIYINPAQRCYAICIAPSNSLVLYICAMGRMWKTVDRGFTLTLLTGFKSNTIDVNMSYNVISNARIGGQHMRVSPTNPLNVGFVHPVDGLYYSTDGGTTWTLSTSVVAPTDYTGGNIYFVSDTDVWVTTKGHQPYHSTTGVNGTFTAVTGGPTSCASISGGGGKVYFIGDGANSDTQCYVWGGAAFTTPVNATGYSVAVNPSLTNKVIITGTGGAMSVSTDTGVTFAATTVSQPKIAHDVPYLGYVNSGFLSLGATCYHPTLDRLFITCGLGVFYLVNPPLTSSNNLISITLGIRQMLPLDVTITPNGKTLIPVMDKAAFIFTRANVTQQASRCGPDVAQALRQAGAIDYALDDENYLVMVYSPFSGNNLGSISTDGGTTWTAMPTIPNYTNSVGALVTFYAGNLAVSAKRNMVWCSSNNSGGSCANGVQYTTDGGTTWAASVFGASVNMTGATWHNNRTYRRHIVSADKGTSGVFYIFCNGLDGGGGVTDLAQLGLWKSTNSGANFTKIRTGHFDNYSVDFYHGKLRCVPGKPGHMFWASGPSGSYPQTPATLQLRFTADDWATTNTITGWTTVDDIAIGAPAPGAAYGALYAVAWRGGVYGLWRSIDFTPATFATATWQLQETWLLNRPDDTNMIAADPGVFGRVVVGITSGGGGVGDNIDLATGT